MNTTSEILENYNGCKCSGGGDSDFSIAKVSFTNAGSSWVLNVPIIFNGQMFTGMDSLDMDGTPVDIALYNGSVMCYVPNMKTATTTGDVTLSDGVLTISGNGTVSFADEEEQN